MPTPYMRWAGKRFRMRDRMKRKSCWSPTVLNLSAHTGERGFGENSGGGHWGHGKGRPSHDSSST